MYHCQYMYVSEKPPPPPGPLPPAPPVDTENSVRIENAVFHSVREIIIVSTMTPFFIALLALVASTFRTRAAQQASLLAKLGRPTVPVVAGEWINSEAIAAAQSYQVWQVLDGRTSPPGEA